MEDTDILQHLLEIEAQAAALVDGAQAEADKRIKAAEEENRLRYEEQYRACIAGLEGQSQTERAAVKAEYEAALEGYRSGLDGLALDRGAFNALAFSLLCAAPLRGVS